MPNQRSDNKIELKLYVTKEFKQKIKRLAQERSTTMTEIVQELLSGELEMESLKKKPARTLSKPSFGKSLAQPIRLPAADPNAMFDDDDAPGQEERA